MIRSVIFSLLGIFFLSAGQVLAQDQLTGSWQKDGDKAREVIIFEDGYFMHSVFTDKEFLSSRGGTYRFDNGKLVLNIEFDTKDKETVGKTENEVFTLSSSGAGSWKGSWKRLDDGRGDLAGNWRITGRKQGEKMNEIRPGVRKTLKILSGSRFQWAAINTETKEFFGTGGGTYTFRDGKYTENIDFFSRDNSRVGASLSFDGKVEGKEWHHSGLSSQGAPIYEIWTRETK